MHFFYSSRFFILYFFGVILLYKVEANTMDLLGFPNMNCEVEKYFQPREVFLTFQGRDALGCEGSINLCPGKGQTNQHLEYI